MATSARELLAMVRDQSTALKQPGTDDANAAITAAGHAGRALHRLVEPRANSRTPRWNGVAQLSRACESAAADWPPWEGRLPDLVGVACDLVGRDGHDVGPDDRWAVAVELAATARRCVEVALRNRPYAHVPKLRWVHGTAVAVEREAARRPPPPGSGTLLDRPVPASSSGQRPQTGVLDEIAALAQALRSEAASAPLPVVAALAAAAASEDAAHTCVHTLTRNTRNARSAWAAEHQAPASWRVVQAALVRFEDGSRHRGAPPSASVAAALRVHEALARDPVTGRPGDEVTASLARVAEQLPPIARELQRAAVRWGREQVLFAKARDLVRREELVPAILANRAVRIAEIDLVPVVAALRVAERLSGALAATANSALDRPTPTRVRALDADARWAARLDARTSTLSPAGRPSL